MISQNKRSSVCHQKLMVHLRTCKTNDIKAIPWCHPELLTKKLEFSPKNSLRASSVGKIFRRSFYRGSRITEYVHFAKLEASGNSRMQTRGPSKQPLDSIHEPKQSCVCEVRGRQNPEETCQVQMRIKSDHQEHSHRKRSTSL